MCAKIIAATFETFLKTLLRHRSRDKRMVIVLDNARYDHVVLLPALASKTSRCAHRAVSVAVRVRSWPRSSAFLKVGPPHGDAQSDSFATLDDVLTAVSMCFDRWRNPNSVLRRLCGII